jgi:hypothetical protein
MTTSYGLPDTFSKRFQKEASRRYFFNIRGNDFLSHNGQWQSSSREGRVDACANSYSEIRSLQALAEENAKGGKSTRLNVSFGPLAGSFFADAVGLRRYRWNNLPAALAGKLQELLWKRSIFSGSGYGTVHDVAINAHEGWILLLKRGKKYHWGGKLPQELGEALQEGLEKKVAISVGATFSCSTTDYTDNSCSASFSIIRILSNTYSSSPTGEHTPVSTMDFNNHSKIF